MKAAFDVCLKEYDVDAQSVKDHTVPANKKCFYKCAAVKLGVMNEAGVINSARYEELLQKHAPAEAVDALKVCAKQTVEDSCQAAENICLCMKEQLSSS